MIILFSIPTAYPYDSYILIAMPNLTGRRKKVAIVGSGAAGLGALWALNRTHHDVFLYEAADRLGGHTNTVDFKFGKYKTAVDTGFIVLNAATYRSLPSLLQHTCSALTRYSQLPCVSEGYQSAYCAY